MQYSFPTTSTKALREALLLFGGKEKLKKKFFFKLKKEEKNVEGEKKTQQTYTLPPTKKTHS